MLTKGNDAKVQNEVMAQIVADTSAKWMPCGTGQNPRENLQWLCTSTSREKGFQQIIPPLYRQDSLQKGSSDGGKL